MVVLVEFYVQLIAYGEFVLQMLYGPDATEPTVHHHGQTGAQSFAFFETGRERKNYKLKQIGME